MTTSCFKRPPLWALKPTRCRRSPLFHKSRCRKGGRQQQFDRLFRFRSLSGHLFWQVCPFFRHFFQTPFAGLVLRQGWTRAHASIQGSVGLPPANLCNNKPTQPAVHVPPHDATRLHRWGAHSAATTQTHAEAFAHALAVCHWHHTPLARAPSCPKVVRHEKCSCDAPCSAPLNEGRLVCNTSPLSQELKCKQRPAKTEYDRVMLHLSARHNLCSDWAIKLGKFKMMLSRKRSRRLQRSPKTPRELANARPNLQEAWSFLEIFQALAENCQTFHLTILEIQEDLPGSWKLSGKRCPIELKTATFFLNFNTVENTEYFCAQGLCVLDRQLRRTWTFYRGSFSWSQGASQMVMP